MAKVAEGRVFQAIEAEHKPDYGLLKWGAWYYIEEGFAFGPHKTQDDANAAKVASEPDDEYDDDEPFGDDPPDDPDDE